MFYLTIVNKHDVTVTFGWQDSNTAIWLSQVTSVHCKPQQYCHDRREKICLQGSRLGSAHTSLLSYKDYVKY